MTEKSAKPYSKFKIAFSYLRYYFYSLSKHGIHSPKVYDFIEGILERSSDVKSSSIERERTRLKKSKQVIDFKDFGKSGNLFQKNISDIAKGSLKPKKYARLLAQTIKHYKAKQVLELGTSLGITTAYIAQHSDVQVQTMEGDPSVAEIAKNVWNQLGLDNISCTTGAFDVTMDTLGDKKYDVIYIDGNHKLEPTLRYFDTLKRNATESTLFIFDDIHYSAQMEQAWSSLKDNPDSSITLDLFFLGFVFLDKTLPKQNFTLRF